jgi:hypothetical protein
MPPNADTPGPPECEAPATAIFDVFSYDGAEPIGSLDAAVYVCEEHAEAYRLAVLDAGLTPWRAGRVGVSRMCGEAFDFARRRNDTWSHWLLMRGAR